MAEVYVGQDHGRQGIDLRSISSWIAETGVALERVMETKEQKLSRNERGWKRHMATITRKM